MGRLDQVCRAMNPFLLLVAVALVLLNLACVVNLIDWRNLPQPPATPVPAASAPAVPGVAHPASTKPAAAAPAPDRVSRN